MRYSGPKMIFKHPVLAIKHIVDERRKLWINRSEINKLAI
jgi:hypothetical protein